MRNIAKNFTKDESGNAVIDWLVLTAGIATLGVVLGATITAGSNEVANDLGANLETMETGVSTSSASTALLQFMPQG